jgi:hypothetical protein
MWLCTIALMMCSVVCATFILSARSEERREYYERSMHTENMQDFHYPDPLGPPNPSQPCAKLLKGTRNMWYCANGYPRDLVCEPCEQSVAQDALRPDLWRCNLRRNCPLMNSHSPVVGLALQSNSDAQLVLTRHQAEMYCSKYCSKHHKRLGTRCALYDIHKRPGHRVLFTRCSEREGPGLRPSR